ncbi:MAG: hypothetical protein BAJALOKI3v1_410031 [Promethearchaeota archaeon]|nr:MAG: hypothetical protein BAJALOKI3v1_410031 [Candidatus Lokiarchaeota archaeon]
MELRESSVSSILHYYKSLNIDRRQNEILMDLSRELAKYIPLSELILQGYGLLAMKDWQYAHKQPGYEISSMSPEDRIRAMKELLQFLLHRLKSTLKSKKYEHQIDAGIEKLLVYYKKTHARR